jgi:hypothetical protein
LIHDNKIFPVIIYKDSLFSLQRQSEPGPSCDQVDIDLSEFGGDKFSINVPKTQHQDFTVKPGRNDLCPCGSGNKYKKCCLY